VFIKKSSNDAVKGELGRYPLYFEALCSTVNFLQRLQQELDVSDVLKDALWESKSLYNCHTKILVFWCAFLLKLLGINENTFLKSVNIVKCVKNKLIEQYKYKWACALDTCAVYRSGQLRTYTLFKNRMCREAYLSIVKDWNIKRCVTSLRISSHKLEIEVGRYKKVESNVQFCKLCVNSNLVEDEVHFMIDCDASSSDTQGWFRSLHRPLGQLARKALNLLLKIDKKRYSVQSTQITALIRRLFSLFILLIRKWGWNQWNDSIHSAVNRRKFN